MEIIKKKICLEDFTSRIPSLIRTYEGTNEIDGSWDKKPWKVHILNIDMKYGTFIDLYYALLKVVMYSQYYQFDEFGKKWIPLNDYDWRNSFYEKKISYSDTLPSDTSNIEDYEIIGIFDYDYVYKFNEEIKLWFGEKIVIKGEEININGMYVLNEMFKILGVKIIPRPCKCKKCGKIFYSDTVLEKCTEKECDGNIDFITQEIYVPYLLYLTEIDDYIKILEKYKTDNNCSCDYRKYDEYGGDAFYTYLKKLKEDELYISDGIEETTIDIPVLLHMNFLDLGQYKAYNVDIIDDTNTNTNNSPEQDNTSILVKTSDESKLRTLRKRKRSVDDNGLELPGIITYDKNGNITCINGNILLESPYEENYVKNIQYMSDYFYCGDTIYSMKENVNFILTTNMQYNELKNYIIELFGEEDATKYYREGIGDKKLDNNFNCYGTIFFGDENETDVEKLIKKCEDDVKSKIITLESDLLKFLKLSNLYFAKQEYKFTYEISYGVIDYDKPYYDEFGNILYETTIQKSVLEYNGEIYAKYDSIDIEFIYVIGGRFTISRENRLILNEQSPFNLSQEDEKEWDGIGIWYRETFPLLKFCSETFSINNKKQNVIYDKIDFSSKEYTYTFENIDFIRKNYILCEEVIYKSDSYKKDMTTDFIFRDEKMLLLNYPLKEKYDVVVDRGISAAFEKHLQLSEIKTWDDLSKYKNGSFLNN